MCIFTRIMMPAMPLVLQTRIWRSPACAAQLQHTPVLPGTVMRRGADRTFMIWEQYNIRLKGRPSGSGFHEERGFGLFQQLVDAIFVAADLVEVPGVGAEIGGLREPEFFIISLQTQRKPRSGMNSLRLYDQGPTFAPIGVAVDERNAAVAAGPPEFTRSGTRLIEEDVGIGAAGKVSGDDEGPVCTPVVIASDQRNVAAPIGAPEFARSGGRLIEEEVGIEAAGEVSGNDEGPVCTPVVIAPDQRNIAVPIGTPELARSGCRVVEQEVCIRAVWEFARDNEGPTCSPTSVGDAEAANTALAVGMPEFTFARSAIVKEKIVEAIV